MENSASVSSAEAPGIALLDTPYWEPAFWPVRYLAASARLEHVPFIFWLVSAVHPRLVVELGIESGASYFAYCQAVDQLSLETRCYAIGAAAADQSPRMGAGYDFSAIKGYNDDHYSSFSTLVNCAPGDAAATFADGSVDLLGLAPRAGADDALQQFEAWLPKLSPDAIVLFANTNPGDGEPGARQAFAALKAEYPTFEFLHGGGLGVVFVGPRSTVLCGALSLANEDTRARWRKCFARLGRGHLDRYLLETETKRRQGGTSAAAPANNAAVEALREQLAQSELDAAAVSEKLQKLQTELLNEQQRFRAKLHENEQLGLTLRNAREELEQLKPAKKQVDVLRSDVTDKASALNRMGARIAILKDEIRRSDRYIAQLLNYCEKQRSQTERRLHSWVTGIQTDTDLETLRTAAVQHEGASTFAMLAAGVRASMKVERQASRKAIYLHYRVVRGRQDAASLALMAGSGLFDPAFYMSCHEDVAKSDVDPLIHFMDFGAAECRDPSPYFDTAFYLDAYPDVAEHGINPLLHFITRGRQEGRSPKPAPSIKAIVGDWNPPAAPPQRVSRDELKPLPKRVVIYTAVAGGYDEIKPPAFRPPHCDFVVFSDHPMEVEGWQVRPLNFLHPDPTRAARFVKLHPHIYFPDYDHSIWIDANIGVRGDIREFFRRLKDNLFLGIFTHPLRDCVYVEAQECIKRKKDTPDAINGHIARYRDAGFPEKAGLWETNVLVRHHKDPRCIDLMLAWWREMEIGCRRDQISLPVVVKRASVEIAALGPPQMDARKHPMLTLVKHPPAQEFDLDSGLPAATRKPVDVDAIPMDVGVCVYNSLDETRACLESVAAARRPNDCIIVVDDASAAPTAAYLDEFAKAHDNVKLVRHETNRGYTAAANNVLRHSSNDWVVLLNSDAVVARNSLPKMIACGEQFPQIGIVGALSNAASWQTVPYLTGPDSKFLVNQIPPHLTVDDMDRVCEELSSGVVPFVPLVNGFCYAIRRKLIEQIGFFDEEGFKQGYGEEDDLCLRAGAAGFLCAIATDAYVFHVKSATFTSDRRRILVADGREVLERKHTPERLKAAVEILKRHPELRRIRDRVAARLRELAPPLVPAD